MTTTKKSIMPDDYIDKYCKRCLYYLDRINISNKMRDALSLDVVWHKDECYYTCWRRNTKGKVVYKEDFLE